MLKQRHASSSGRNYRAVKDSLMGCFALNGKFPFGSLAFPPVSRGIISNLSKDTLFKILDSRSIIEGDCLEAKKKLIDIQKLSAFCKVSIWKFSPFYEMNPFQVARRPMRNLGFGWKESVMCYF